MRAAVPIAQRETLGAELDADRTESSDNRMAGATTAQIMDVTGYRDPKSLRRYTRRELLHDVRPGCAPLYCAVCGGSTMRPPSSVYDLLRGLKRDSRRNLGSIAVRTARLGPWPAVPRYGPPLFWRCPNGCASEIPARLRSDDPALGQPTTAVDANGRFGKGPTAVGSVAKFKRLRMGIVSTRPHRSITYLDARFATDHLTAVDYSGGPKSIVSLTRQNP
jgi:hypothetical protein